MIPKRVIFTGQPGVKIDKTINDFIANASPFVRGKQTPLFLNIEDEMKKVYAKNHGNLTKNKRKDLQSIWLKDILTLPIPDLYKLWEAAFNSIIEKINENENKKRDIFLNLHACFYHHYTVEYLSFIKIKCIKEFKPKLIITLIDDIYDIHDKLREPNQIFNPSYYGGATEPIGAILELLRILDWRSIEIIISKLLANEMDIPHYVFAVKHSYDTLYSLIFTKKSKFYISHPISEVRRLQKEGERNEAEKIIDAIHRLEIKSSSEFISFLPTTIDELRIHKEEKDKKILLEPKLMPRWDLEKYQNPIDLLFIPPSKDKTSNPLWQDNFKYSKELNLLLKALYNKIEVQVSSRDHKLVEQSDFLFVYKPCFNGNASTGVLKEIQYYSELNKNSRNKKCFIYLPTEDQNKLKIKQLEEIIEKNIERKDFKYKGKGQIRLNSSEANKLIGSRNNLDTTINLLQEIMETNKISFNHERKGLESDKVQKVIDFLSEIAKNFISGFKQTLNTYKQAATVLWEENNLEPEILVDRIVKHLKNK